MGLHNLLLWSAVFSVAEVAAYRRYLNYAPNSDLVPCPVENGAAYAGCHGTGICEAWGHEGCWPLQPESTGSGGQRRLGQRSEAAAENENAATAEFEATTGLAGEGSAARRLDGRDDGGDGVSGITTAGTAMKQAIRNGGWNVETCSGDSDGDGK